jgi:hypothetical protein
MLEEVVLLRPAVICVSALPPAALHARNLCGHLRTSYPKTKVVLGLWEFSGDGAKAKEKVGPNCADAPHGCSVRVRHLMNILDLVVGKPIRTSDERAERVSPAQGIPIFGLDAISSAAYGPEAALSLLIPLGLLGVRYIVPISAAIITLLVIVYFSYRQTIAAYPSGGGSYTVARFNLGAPAGLLAAAALLADYILTAAVGISAGVGALISAVPSLLPHTVAICVAILIVITVLNLRGVREAGLIFAVPTYLFVGTLLTTVVVGVFRVVLSGGHPTPVVSPATPSPMIATVSYWLLLKVFASGCTALTA